MRRVVTDFDNSKKLYAPPLPATLVRRGNAAMSDTRPMTPEQAATLKELAKAAYELDAFKPNLRRAEAEVRIAMLTAKLKLLDGPPHTL
jgi:hypothetical protein